MNNKVSGAIGALLMALAGPALAQGDFYDQDSGFYGGAEGGLAFFDVRIDGEDLDLNTGFAVSGMVGYEMNGPFRFEIEGGYNQADIDETTVTLNGVGPLGIDGTVSNYTLMGNAYFDLETGTALEPHIGVGAGGARVEIDSNVLDEDDIVFAWNAIAGLDYSFDGRMTFSAQYRYLQTDDASIEGIEVDTKVHLIQAGARLPF